MTKSENICKTFIDNNIIEILISKISEHIKPIRDLIYDSLLYLIKQTSEYNQRNFNITKKEEGKITINPNTIYNQNEIKGRQSLTILKEKPELLKILFVIISNNNKNKMKEITEFIDQVFEKKENNTEELYSLIDIISALIQMNDICTYDRLIQMAGYPSMVVRPIPKEDDDNNSDSLSLSDSDSDGDNKEKIENEKMTKSKKNMKQKWPLFGERLIDGDIKKEIYEYLIPDHRKNGRCLLAILFPSEYELQKEEGNNDNVYKRIRITEDKKKEILLDLMKTIYNERNNYPLFKYLYLTPARSLLYRNLYSEIITYLDLWNNPHFPYSIQNSKEKEAQYIDFVEKEVKTIIDLSVKKDEEESNEYKDKNELGYDERIYDGKFFECKDKNMIYFTGFISEIIPGEVIREEIFGIAKRYEVAMYRIHYYTKYYYLDELRERLLHPNKYIKEDSQKEESKEKEPEFQLNEKSEKNIEKKDDKSNLSKIGSSKETINEINRELENESKAVKYNVLEKNENSFIYKIYKEKDIFILEDESIMDEHKVKNTLIRFIFFNGESKKKSFYAKCKSSKMSKKKEKNCFFVNQINDYVRQKEISYFLTVQRFRDNLEFIKEDDVIIAIVFNS